jgi:hypothetical protein
MAVIKSGDSTDELTVDPTSKAARSTLYDSEGNPVFNPFLGSYSARIEIIPSTLTDGTTYWSMRNLGANRVFINRLLLKIGFSGTAAATRSLFNIGRFSVATPTAGTAITAVKKDNLHPATSVTDIRFAPGGLTTTGVTFEAPMHVLGPTNQLNDDHYMDLRFGDLSSISDKMILAIGEGLCIRAIGAVVAGSHLLGSIHWDERV